MGDIPQELGWTILVLIPKGNMDTRGIGLLNTLWKVVEALIYTCLRASIQFHEVLHGFQSGRGTGTAIIDLDPAQELASVDHDPIFLVFLELRKSYNTVDRELRIQTLEEYGAVSHMCGFLEKFWSHQKVVPRQNGYHGLALPSA